MKTNHSSSGGVFISAVFFAAFLIISTGYSATFTVTNNNDSGAGSLRAALIAASNGDTIVFNGSHHINLTGTPLTTTQDVTIDSNGFNPTVDGAPLVRLFNLTAGNTVTIKDLNYIDGHALSSVSAGAIFLSSGTLNLEVTGTNTSTFSGNTAGLIPVPRSIFIDNHGTLNINTAAGATLDMRDPMAGDSNGSSIYINKLGAGTWKLAGTNEFGGNGVPQVGETFFSVNAGTLYLYRGGVVPGVGAGVIDLNGKNSVFTLATGATIISNGANGIEAQNNGTINLQTDSTIAFNLAGAASGTEFLDLNADTITVGASIDLDLLSLNPAGGTYTLLDNNGGTNFIGKFATSSLRVLGQPILGGTRLDGILSLTVNNNKVILQQNAIVNKVMTWTGVTNGNWNQVAQNWSGDPSQQFLGGDIVNFDGTEAAPSSTINITPNGVRVAGIFVSGAKNYTFTGGAITSDGASGTSFNNAGAALGKLVLGQIATGISPNSAVADLLYTGIVDFSALPTNTFAGGVDIYSGTLKIATIGQLGTTLSNLQLLGTTALNPGVLQIANGSAVTFLGGGGLTNRLSLGAGKSGKLVVEPNATLAIQNGNAGLLNGGAIVAGANSLLTLSSGANAEFIFDSNSANFGGAIYALNGLTINGTGSSMFDSNHATLDGGAIATYNNLASLGDNATFLSNTAGGNGGAIFAYDGDLAIGNNATFTSNSSANGGAIFAGFGVIVVPKTVVIGNNANFSLNTTPGNGGAIHTYNDLTIGNSATFATNSATGLLLGSGNGGAIYAYNADVTLGDFATFTSNSATGNGGGIFSGVGALPVASNLVIGNNASFSSNTAVLNGGAIYAYDTNLTIGDFATFASNSSANGGAIFSGSGVLPIPTTVIIGDDASFSLNTTLENGGAIYTYNDLTIGDNASFSTNSATNLLAGNGGAIYAYDANVTIGNGAEFTSNAAVNGGAIYAASGILPVANTVAIGNNANFSFNTAVSTGGAIYVYDSNLTIGDDATFASNTATNGGGIFSGAGAPLPLITSVLIGNGATFTSNSATVHGGGLNVYGKDLTIGDDATFTTNSAGVNGGGIYLYNGDLLIGDNATFTSNTAGQNGGGVYSGSGIVLPTNNSVTIGDNAEFTSNSAAWHGGGVYVYDGHLTIGNGATFTTNSALGSGGGIYVGAGILPVAGDILIGDDATFSGNTAVLDGGAIYGEGNVTIGNNSLFEDNAAGGSGGAIYAEGNVTLGNNIGVFLNNTAGDSGGAIYSGGTVAINSGAVFSGNIAGSEFGGGAIDAQNVQLLADTDDIVFSGNFRNGDGVQTPNSIVLRSGTLSIDGGFDVYFDDPILNGVGSSNNTFVKNGVGGVQFQGSSVLNSNSQIGGEVNINAGEFHIVTGASFATGGTDDKKFNVATGALLSGGGTISSLNGFVIGGTVSPDSLVHSPVSLFFSPGGGSIGTLALVGNALFDTALFEVDTDVGNVSDLITVDGAVTFQNTNTVSVGNWTDGVFIILSSSGITGTVAGNFGPVLVNDGPLNSRQYANLEIVNSNQDLQLTLASDNNTNLRWTNDSGDRIWNTTSTNWTDSLVPEINQFINNDAVTFGIEDSGDVHVPNNVLVASLTVDGGDHVFDGAGAINSSTTVKNQNTTTNTTNPVNLTKVLSVDAGSATFKNTGGVNFENGLNIGPDGTVTLGDGGFFANSMIVTNDGFLVIDRSVGNDYDYAGVIAGTGNAQKLGTGKLTISGANTNSGTFTQTAGAVHLATNWAGSYVQDASAGIFTSADGAVIGSPPVDAIVPLLLIPGDASFSGVVAPTGVLNVTNNLTFSGATYLLDIPTGPQIAAGGTATFDGANTVAVTNWVDGVYAIVTSSGITGTVAGNFGPVLVNDGPLNSRQYANLEIVNSNQDLQLTLASDNNTNLRWTNDSGDRIWNTTSTNWTDSLVPEINQFINNDAVTFGIEDSGDVHVPNNVLVASLTVDGGDHVFDGAGAINSSTTVKNQNTTTNTTNPVNLTKVLSVDAGSATFKNTGGVNFENGLNIGPDGTVTLGDGGFFANSMIVNDNGLLIIDRSAGNDYDFAGVIAGTGNAQKLGTGKLTISGANTNTGVFTQTAGDVHLETIWAGSYTQDASAGIFTSADGAVIGGGAPPEEQEIPSLFAVEVVGDAFFTTVVAPTGVLNVTNNLGFQDATYVLDVPTGSRINATGTATFDGTNTVDVTNWTDGIYTIVNSSGITGTVADNFGPVTENSGAPGARKDAILSVVNSNQDLQIDLSSNNNRNLTWTGATSNDWTGPGNWSNPFDLAVNQVIDNDALVFGPTGEGTIEIPTDVLVASLTVNGGNYVFTGEGAVASSTTVKNPAGKTFDLVDLTQKFTVNTGTNLAIQNTGGINFAAGMEIADGARVALIRGGGLAPTMPVLNNGTLFLSNSPSPNHEIGALTNNGLIIYDSPGQVFTINGLSGNGTVAMGLNIGQNLTDFFQINGDVSGHQRLLFVNVGGALPAPTQTQFRIGSVTGNNPNSNFSGGLDLGEFSFGLREIGQDVFLVRAGPSSTTQVANSIAGTQTLMWFAQQDNLLKRMGDQRLDSRKSGDAKSPIRKSDNFLENAWVRSYGQQENISGEISGASYRVQQWGIDIGADRAIQVRGLDNVTVGGFFGYGESYQDFNNLYGSSGESNATSFGTYATWLHDSGWFADAVLKGSYFNNEFTAIDESRNASDADYNDWGLGFSLEAGKQIAFAKDWIVEPSVQASFVHLFSDGYPVRGSNPLDVGQNDSDVLQLRAGARLGRNIRVKGQILQPYIKVAVVEQVSGGNNTDLVNYSGRPDLDGVRGEFGAGLIWAIGNNQQIHLDYEAAVSDDYTRPWGINAGYRIYW